MTFLSDIYLTSLLLQEDFHIMKNRIFKFAVVFVFLISSLVFPLETAFADDTDTQITVSFYLDRNSAKWYAWVGSPGAVLGSLREDLEAYLAELTNADGKRFHNWTTADGAAFSLSNEINESIDLYANYDHVWSSTTGKCIYCNIDHDHSWGDWQVIEGATCQKQGIRRHTCSGCNFSVQDKYDGTHDLQLVSEVEANCTTAGNIAHYKCSTCNQLFDKDDTTLVLTAEQVNRPALGHDWVESISGSYLVHLATCTEPEEYYKSCSRCQESANSVAEELRPDPATFTSGTPNGHDLDHVEGVAATCTAAGNVSYYKCTVCDKLFKNEDGTNELTAEQVVIPAKSKDGTHVWDESGPCTRCPATAFRLTATFNNLGTVKVNGTDVTSGTPVFLMPGEAAAVTFTPNENMFLNEVTVGGAAVTVTDNSFTIPAAEALGDTAKTIAVSFSNHITGAAVTVKFANASEAKNTQASSHRSTLATGTVTADDIKVIAKEVIPVWADAEGNPTNAELTPEEIEDAVPISFKMPYPDGINDTNRGNYRYYVFHLGETPASCSISDIRADGLATSSTAFSAFASFAVPKAAQSAPAINVRHRLNNGTLRTGALLNVSNLMEYRVGDSTTYVPITGSGSTWVGDASTGLVAGTYHVRYKGTGEKLPSPETNIQIDDYYTVYVQIESGTGEWLAVSGTVEEYNGACVVKKGNTLGLTFTAGDGYVVDHITEGTKITTPRTKTTNYLVTDVTSSRTVKVSFRTPSSIPIIDYTVSPEPIEVLPVVDGGTTQKGHIYFRTDGRQIEYIKSTTAPTNSSKWIKLDGTKLSNLAAGGNYWYKYVGQDASRALVTPLLDLYTVTIEKKGSGKGTYEVAGYEKDPDNIYLVEKGEDITVTFKPSTGYWLYEVDVNGVYVGQSKVKETMTFKDIEKKTKIEYAFSDSSRSPKTGDRSEVNLWIAEEILSFLGMTTITWYLFRRKETY